MQTKTRLSMVPALLPLLALGYLGCSTQEPVETTYFERSIAPLFTSSCVRTSTGGGCHVSTPKGNAFGNLDLSSYATTSKRRDLLIPNYGPYGQSAFLLKSIEPVNIEVRSFDGTRTTVQTDIKHAGGSVFSASAGAYLAIKKWIQNGATENNTGKVKDLGFRGECVQEIGTAAGFRPAEDPSRPDFAAFRDRAAASLKSCAASNCHGNTANDLYLTCGTTPEQIRWNYYITSQYLAKTPEESELLRKPLNPERGGTFHEGGIIFDSPDDSAYKELTDWAKAYGPFTPENIDPNFLFFANRVQPLLVKKGCMMAQCHTPSQFNEYRIRGGSGGNFSLVATRKNYELSLEQLAVESPNVNASRLVRKNLFRPEVSPGGSGILHRGGPLLEDFTGQNADAALCDPATNYDTVDLNDPKVPAYCIINEWHKRERATRNPAPLSAVVFVKRPTMPANFRAQDFGEFAPGAELHLTQVTLGGPAPVLGADTNLNAGCGFTGSVDIRRPSVSWDGKTIAFAARLSAAEPLKIYTAAADGTNCKLHVEANAGAATENGLLVHNFDPAFSPPDAAGESTLVFASTRGNLRKEAYDYAGPQRTPSDPSKLNANLYAYAPGKPIRQMTFLLNTEREVSFMADGRLIFSAEKRAKDFYQLSLRRQNLDGGDYHPLFAQRGSIGFLEARNVVELLDRNLATVMSDPGVPFGGGTLAIINRSIGLDFQSKDATQYPLDPTVIDPASRTSPDPAFFLRSLRFSDPTVGAKPNVATTGLFYAPSPFPDGRVLVSYGAATNTSSFTGDYDLYLVDPVSGQRTKLLGDTGPAEIEAAAVFGRPARRLLTSNSEEPNGKTRIVQTETDATVHILDTPLLASLLFQNTPTGRPVEKLETVELLEDLPPPTTVADYAQGGANVATDAFGKVYVRRRSLGQITLATDGSTRFKVPGGLPVLFRLPDTDDSRKGQWPRLQRESYAFYPGERANQSFKREFFDSLCGTCHNSLSGSPLDASSRPDILTQASVTLSRDAKTIDLNMPPAQRGKEEGP